MSRQKGTLNKATILAIVDIKKMHGESRSVSYISRTLKKSPKTIIKILYELNFNNKDTKQINVKEL